MEIIRLQNKQKDKCLFVQYLRTVDKDFEIPLSSKVDLEFYADKLLGSGYVLAVMESVQIVSVIGFYCNNQQTKVAHLPLLSSLKNVRGKGYAKLLIKNMIFVCKENGMNKIYCDSVNPVAIGLYKSMGFIEIKEENINSLSKIYLEYKIE